MKGTVSFTQIIMSVIAIVLSIALIPVITSFITTANQTGTLGTVLDLVPLVFVFGVVIITVGAFISKK